MICRQGSKFQLRREETQTKNEISIILDGSSMWKMNAEKDWCSTPRGWDPAQCYWTPKA